MARRVSLRARPRRGRVNRGPVRERRPLRGRHSAGLRGRRKGQPVDRHPVRAKRVAEGLGHRERQELVTFAVAHEIGRPRRASKRVAHSFAAMCVPDMRTSPASARDERSATSRASIAPCEKPPSTSLAAGGHQRAFDVVGAIVHLGPRLVEPLRDAIGVVLAQREATHALLHVDRPPRATSAVLASENEGSLGKDEARPRRRREDASEGDEIVPWRAEPVEKDDDGHQECRRLQQSAPRGRRGRGFHGPLLIRRSFAVKRPPPCSMRPYPFVASAFFWRAKGDSRASRGISMGSIGALLSFNEVQMGSRVTREALYSMPDGAMKVTDENRKVTRSSRKMTHEVQKMPDER